MGRGKNLHINQKILKLKKTGGPAIRGVRMCLRYEKKFTIGADER